MSQMKHDYDYMKELYDRVTSLELNGVPGIRDFFATSALSVLANNKISFFQKEDEYKFSWPDPVSVAGFAYGIADAMLKEREKKNVVAN